jgi:hypothetical protein
MEFTPFGELTMLLYNSAKNPEPIMLKKDDKKKEGYGIISRRAIDVQFTDIGVCSVDSKKNLYIEDQVGEEAVSATEDPQYREIIKRFDRLGNYVDTIGRTGKNGLPFPTIVQLFVTNQDQLVVICRTAKGSTVYWFNAESSLLYEVEFDYLTLPVPKDSTYIPSIGRIVPDYNEKKLHIMISYYANQKDESTRLVSRVNYKESRIYSFDLVNEKYDQRFIAIPAVTEQKNDPLFSKEKQETPVPYNFLGFDDTNRIYLLKMKNKTMHELLVLDGNGKTIKKLRLFIDDTNVLAIDFKIAKTGLLYALITENTCVRVVLWRSDRATRGLM